MFDEKMKFHYDNVLFENIKNNNNNMYTAESV